MNFAPELSEAIAETKCLEKLGFGVSYVLRSNIWLIQLFELHQWYCRFRKFLELNVQGTPL